MCTIVTIKLLKIGAVPPSLGGPIRGPLDLGGGYEAHLREQGGQAVLVHLAGQIAHEQRLLALHRLYLGRPAVRAQLHITRTR